MLKENVEGFLAVFHPLQLHETSEWFLESCEAKVLGRQWPPSLVHEAHGEVVQPPAEEGASHDPRPGDRWDEPRLDRSGSGTWTPRRVGKDPRTQGPKAQVHEQVCRADGLALKSLFKWG